VSKKFRIYEPQTICHSDSMTRNNKPVKQFRRAKDPLGIVDIVRHIILFSPNDRYLYIGTVSKLFHSTWVSKSPASTRPIFKGVTVPQVLEAYDSGLGAMGHIRN